MDDRPTPDFPVLIARLAGQLEEYGFPFMLIGGQAVLLHGRPRLTEDIDVTLGADVRRLPDLLGVCADLALNVLPENPAQFAQETSVVPAQDPTSGIRVDFIFSTTPFELQAIARAVRKDLAGQAVPFASAEDLILHKLFAGRPRDHEDVLGVVRRRGKELDWDYLDRWAREFASVPGREDLPETVSRLKDEEMA